MSPYVFDASAENFATLVLENSNRGPVLVHFWSAKAAPCMILMPRLVRLATEYAGKFLLVMFNTDELGRLARQYGITSVPTVKVFRAGEIVYTIHGAQPDAEFRDIIERHITRDSDLLHAAAVQEYQAGNTEHAFALLTQARASDPKNLRIPVDHAKLMVAEQRYQEAKQILSSLPEQARASSAVVNLRTHVELLEAAKPDADIAALRAEVDQAPQDSAKRLVLAATLLLHDDYDSALENFLALVRDDRAFNDDIGRRAIIAIFDLLGNQGELVNRYRSLLFAML